MRTCAFKGALHFRNATGVSFSSGQWVWIVHLLLLCGSFAPWATEYTGPYEDSFWERGGFVWEPESKPIAFEQYGNISAEDLPIDPAS